MSDHNENPDDRPATRCSCKAQPSAMVSPVESFRIPIDEMLVLTAAPIYAAFLAQDVGATKARQAKLRGLALTHAAELTNDSWDLIKALMKRMDEKD